MRAFVDGNLELAGEVVSRDIEINEARFEVERRCYALLAMEQPVAGDMRAIVAALTVSNELERIGDHAKRIADNGRRFHQHPSAIPIASAQRMHEKGVVMLDRALRAYAARDIAEAEAVCRGDDEVDALYKQLFNITLSYMLENVRSVGAGTYLIQVGHELERVADRATNIAERTIYVVTGQLIDLNV
jgi:phosphate transport system protein